MVEYLVNVPQDVEKWGFCKTLLVRRETIHIKHIFTEIFMKETVDLDKILNQIEFDYKKYMKYMTNRIRKIYKFPRHHTFDINRIITQDKTQFFPSIELYFNPAIVLDFDGVLTKPNFHNMYKLCLERAPTYIVSANPNITKKWFTDHNLPIPKHIFSTKGKKAKVNSLLLIAERHDQTFYVDDEDMYLELAWIFGIQTFKYIKESVKFFTLKT